MKRNILALLLSLCTLCGWADVETNPTAVVNLVERVCWTGASDHFTFTLNPDWNGGAEAFQLGSASGKVTVTANTLSALTCGLNWYLNHEAHVNIAWNNLRQNVTSFPTPGDTDVHEAQYGQYRYYLNYCTYSYSMSFYDWERWEKEIDWMALHGVNLPLVVVGMDAVWYRMLRAEFAMSHDEATAFIAGPAFQGWWLMNNITNVGGNNPEWWYARQARLGKQITDRMRELGMRPCLPGYVGMAPESIAGSSPYSSKWNGYKTPCIINTSQTSTFNGIAQKYYDYIHRVFDFWPDAYSIDPFHEIAYPSGVTDNAYKALCTTARQAIVNYGNCANPLWVAQEWQDNANQGRIDALLNTNSLLLDLCSERVTSYQGRYKTIPYAFCLLNNYGGNIGMHGMLNQMLTNYHNYKGNSGDGTHGVLSGVGVTPEGIENNPMVYDLLFELPWMATVPTTADDWLRNYTESRYGSTSDDVKTAWLNLLGTNSNRSIYNNNSTKQQGCQEPVFCARPNLSGNTASQWAWSSYYWDKDKVIEAAYKILTLGSAQNAANYDYDVVDFVRQAITDYAHTLQMDMAGQNQTGARFAQQVEGFYQMMDDVETLLGTLEDFRLGRWVGAARKITTEPEFVDGNVGSRTAADWLEWNARLLITTWFDNQQTLIDYANREYQGLISGYYKPRWKAYFDKLKAGESAPNNDWYFNNVEIPFTNGTLADVPSYGGYAAGQATGNAYATAQAMMQKYCGVLSNGKYYSPHVTTNVSSGAGALTVEGTLTAANVMEKLNGVFTAKTTGSSIVSYCFDLDDDGSFNGESEYTEGVPSCPNVDAKCRITMSDGALVIVNVNVGDHAAPTTIDHDGWTYTCTNIGTSLTLTGATKTTGTNDVTLPATVEQDGITYRVTALAPGFMAGNTDVTGITLPSTLARVSQQQFVPTEGEYASGRKWTLLPTLGNEDWELTVKMHVGTAAYSKNALFVMSLIPEDKSIFSFGGGLQFWHDWTNNKKTCAFTSSGTYPIAEALDLNGNSTGISDCDATIRLSYSDGYMTLNISNNKGGSLTRTYPYAMPANGLSQLVFEHGEGTDIVSVAYTIPSKLAQKIVGDGSAKTVNPPFTLTNDKNWTITARFQTNGATYNEWGSGLFATGTDALAATYSKGFQYYLKKNGQIVYKINSGSDTHTSSFAVATGEDAYLTIDHVANGATTFRLDQGSNNDSYTTADNVTFNDITVLSSAIPAGITIEDIAFDMDGVESSPVFEGCSSLTSISVAAGNRYFAAEDGVLYDINKMTLKRVPEGKTGELTPASTLKRVSSNAFANSSATIPVDLNNSAMRAVVPAANTMLVVNTAQDNATALAAVDGTTYGKVKVVRTPAAAGAWDAIMLPFAWNAADLGRSVKVVSGIAVANSRVTLNFGDATDIEAGKLCFIAPEASSQSSVRAKAVRKASAQTEEVVFAGKTIVAAVQPQTFTDGDVTVTIAASYDSQEAAAGDYTLGDTSMSAASGNIPAGMPKLTVAGIEPVYVLFEGEAEPDPVWPAVTANGRDSNAASQYVSSITINGTTVYTKSANLDLTDPADGPQVVITSSDVHDNANLPTLQPGQTVTVAWSGTDGLKYTYLSVYFDKNANQQFEHESASNTECLGYVGSKGAQNTAVSSGSFTFTIPADMPDGVTCLRMRFDGAWMANSLSTCCSNITVPCLQSGSSATGTAVDPNYTTNRTTYDIHFRVLTQEPEPILLTDDNFSNLFRADECIALYAPQTSLIANGPWFVPGARATSEPDAANFLKLIATGTENQFKLQQCSTGKYISNSNAGNNITLTNDINSAGVFIYVFGLPSNNGEIANDWKGVKLIQLTNTSPSSGKTCIVPSGNGTASYQDGGQRQWSMWAVYNVTALAPATMPDPAIDEYASTIDAPHWYLVKFNNGNWYLSDEGEGSNMKVWRRHGMDAQQWMLIGNNTAGFKMLSKRGNYIGFSNGKFITTTEANAVLLQLVHNADKYELRVMGDTNCMNMDGGAGAGKQLAKYDAGNDGNILVLEEAAQMEAPTFSTVDAPVWYNVKFVTGGIAVSEVISTSPLLKTATLCKGDPRQRWQLIGNVNDGFKLRNERGTYIGFASSRYVATNEANAVTMKMRVWNGGFELYRADVTEYTCMNPNGGNEADKELCEWNYDKDNNRVVFEVATATLPDFPETAVLPTVGKSYYIAAQCLIDGQWVERFLCFNSDTKQIIKDTPDDECVWACQTYGNGISLHNTFMNKWLHSWGFSSSNNTESTVAPADVAMVAGKDFVTIYAGGVYVFAKQDGSALTAAVSNAGAVGNHLPDGSGANDGGVATYTPFFKFYEVDTYGQPQATPAPKYYQLKFKTGGNCLADKGTGNNLLTAADNATDDAQHWTMLGTPTNFKMRSKLGNYIGLANSRFNAVAAESDAVVFRLVPNGDDFELQRIGQNKCMNQWGATTAGTELGEWNAGDGNNILGFVVAPVELNVGGLTFYGEVNGSEATLVTYKPGETDNVTLTHTATADEHEYTVADLTPVFNVLNTVGTATTVAIADDITSLGEAYPAYVPQRSAGFEEPATQTGTTTNNATKETYTGSYKNWQWDLDPTLDTSRDCWNLNVKVECGEQRMNVWGIFTLASGTDPVGTSYPGGFQFYQNHSTNGSDGLIIYTGTLNGTQKTSKKTVLKSNNAAVYLQNCTVTFELKYRRARQELRVVVFTDNGIAIDQTITGVVIDALSNLCARFGADSRIVGLTYNFINEESDEPVGATTWLNNANISLAPTPDDYAGKYVVDANGSLWGSKRKQQLLRVPSAVQNGDGNRFTVPESLLAASPDAFLNNPSAKVNLGLQQYLMVKDVVKPRNTSIAMTENSDGEEALMSQVASTSFAEVTLDRKPSASKWNTFVLPFDISGDEQERYISDVYAFESVSSSGDNVVLKFVRHTDDMRAGVPYLVKGTDDAAAGLVFANKSLIAPTVKELSDDNYTITVYGKYDRTQLHGDNIYYISSDKFYYAASPVTMKGFRAYVEITENGSNAPAQVRFFNFTLGDGVATDVDEIEVVLTPDERTYNLNGQRVYNAKGIVIRNGNKVVIK